MFKRLLLAILFLVPVSSFASISVNNAVRATPLCSVSSLSYSATVSTGDDVLIVSFQHHNFTATVSATYGGVSMTHATSSSNQNTSTNDTYFLLNPTIGTDTVQVTVSSAAGCISAHALTLSGVDTARGLIRTTGNSDASNPYSLASYTNNELGLWTYGSYSAPSGGTFTAGSDTSIIFQPEPTYFGDFAVYSSVVNTADPMYINLTGGAGGTVYGMMLLFAPSSGGGGGGGGGSISIDDSYLSASLSTIYATTSPSYSGSTFTSSSTSVSTTTLQGGVVFIVHTSTSSPSVTWNGNAMTFYASTTSSYLSSFVTSVFHIPTPSSGNIVVSGVASSAIKYFVSSVWNNGNLVSTYGTRNVDIFSTKAYVDLGNFNYPATGISMFTTLTGLPGYGLIANNNQIMYATSSIIGDFSLQSAFCDSTFDSCNVGFEKLNYFGLFGGDVVGIALNSLATISYSTSTAFQSLTQVFGNFGTDAGFQQCSSAVTFGTIIPAIGCLFKNTFFWFVYLFIPAPNAYIGLQNMILTSMSSTSTLLTSVVSLPFQFFLWTSTTTVPTYNTIGLDIPRFSGVGNYEMRFSGTTTPVFSSIDNAIYNFIDTWFPLLILLWIGMIGFHLFYS